LATNALVGQHLMSIRRGSAGPQRLEKPCIPKQAQVASPTKVGKDLN
jgi:hypothetical protein